jgi:hypothetical protein
MQDALHRGDALEDAPREGCEHRELGSLVALGSDGDDGRLVEQIGGVVVAEDGRFEDGVEQVLLGSESRVDRFHGNVGVPGDVLDGGRREAPFGEQFARRVNDLPSGVFGLFGPSRTRQRFLDRPHSMQYNCIDTARLVLSLSV